jgi:hypothetical protein
MTVKQPLSDAWLYWDPERISGYPHTSDPEPERAQSTRGGEVPGAGKRLRLCMFEDLLLYVAGIASALVGVALAVLLGSFISAYSMLNDFGERARRPIVPYPEVRSDQIRPGETDTMTTQSVASAVK